MTSGTSIFHFAWALTPHMYHEKTLENIRKIAKHVSVKSYFSYLNFLEFRTNPKYGPPDPANQNKYCCFLCLEFSPPKKGLVSPIVFDGFSQNTFWDILEDPLFWQNQKASAHPIELTIFLKEYRPFWPKVGPAWILGILGKPDCWSAWILSIYGKSVFSNVRFLKHPRKS